MSKSTEKLRRHTSVNQLEKSGINEEIKRTMKGKDTTWEIIQTIGVGMVNLIHKKRRNHSLNSLMPSCLDKLSNSILVD